MFPYIQIGTRTIGVYGLFMLLGLSLALLLSHRRGRRYGLIMEDLLIIGATALLCALFAGGMMYLSVTYSPEQILTMLRQGNLRGLFGGIVFYGGLIGGIFGALLGIRIAGCSVESVEQAVIPFVPLGHAVGRIGCVMAGCCHGFAYNGPFALHYPHAVTGLSHAQGYFPVQPLESLLNIGICLLLLAFSRRLQQKYSLLFAYLGTYAPIRFLLEFLRGDSIRGAWGGLSTSQWGSLLLFFISLVFFSVRYFKARSVTLRG